MTLTVNVHVSKILKHCQVIEHFPVLGQTPTVLVLALVLLWACGT
jgi:hypothetical protein